MTFDWTRYWLPLSEEPVLDQEGYFSAPYSEIHGRRVRFRNQTAQTLEELNSLPCLVLLGAPGAGKSTELAGAVGCAKDCGEDPFVVRLGAIGGEAGLYRKLLDHPRTRAWREDAQPVTRFLDALDEGILHIENVAAVLREELFAELPSTGGSKRKFARALRLRVTCRSGDWPMSLTTAFEKLWEEEDIGTYRPYPSRSSRRLRGRRSTASDEKSGV